MSVCERKLGRNTKEIKKIWESHFWSERGFSFFRKKWGFWTKYGEWEWEGEEEKFEKKKLGERAKERDTKVYSRFWRVERACIRGLKNNIIIAKKDGLVGSLVLLVFGKGHKTFEAW